MICRWRLRGSLTRCAVEIYNASDVAVRQVRFEIAKESLNQFDLRGVAPRPATADQSREWQVFHYPEVHPRERRSILLELVPKRAGKLHLVLQLTSGAGAFHGMADIPIQVCPRHRGPAVGRQQAT